jgi:hypothetical protein
MEIRRMLKWSAIWMSPVAGGFVTAAFLTLRNIHYPYSEAANSFFSIFFIVDLCRDTVANYFFALPLLLVARRFNLRSLLCYACISALAGLPVAYMLANPIDYAWQPSDEDFVHGPYWFFMFTYLFFSCTTGLLFGLGAKRPNLTVERDCANTPSRSPSP